ncbi:Probable pectate lyase 3 [Linum perenne]
MGEISYTLFAYVVITLVWSVVIPTTCSASNDDQEYWHRRALKANENTKAAYHPDPLQVVDHLNLHVHKAMSGVVAEESTRRELRNKKKTLGACEATNPIDRCWRCDKNWAKDRKKLAGCALGFGRGTTGGKDGDYYLVTDASDFDAVKPKPGTLRHAVTQNRPLWITFEHSMVISLSQELLINSNKTIDGRGANVRIANGGQLTLQFVDNVIIHGIHVHDTIPRDGGMIRSSEDHFGQRSRSDGDGISLFGATNVWLDHISMSNCADGLIDVIMKSTAVTISNCHFTKHNDVMLVGASDTESGDKVIQLTLAFNHFGRGLVQRMPRLRWGFAHVVNNDYTHWEMYAIGGNFNPTIICQGNRFVAPPNDASKEVTKREYTDEGVWKSWIWKSENDLLENGAFFVQSGGSMRPMDNKDVINAKHGSYVSRLTRCSGAIDCVVDKPC